MARSIQLTVEDIEVIRGILTATWEEIRDYPPYSYEEKRELQIPIERIRAILGRAL